MTYCMIVNQKINLLRSLVKAHSTVCREMSKQRSKQAKSKSNESKLKKPEHVPEGPLRINKEGNIVITIQAKPGSKHNNITGITDEAIGVAISAPPIEGEANAELLRYLATVLEVRKSDVRFDKGSRSRHKSVIVSGSTKEEVMEKLKQQLNS